MIKETDKVLSRVDERLKRIANVLLINASFTDNLGLLNGKMGIAIFFYLYARYTNNKIFSDYAGDLIDEIYSEINESTSINFADGLMGIGWGIEYLVKNNFVEADTDEVLSDIDNAIYKHRINSPLLLSTGCDFFDYGLYYISRLKSSSENDDLKQLMKKHHLIFLIDECERIFIYKRYLDFNIETLKIGTINSILWFLLEMYKVGLLSFKVKKLLGYLPTYLCFSNKEDSTLADYYFLYRLLKRAYEFLSDDALHYLYKSVIENYSINLYSQVNNDIFIRNITYFNLLNFIYELEPVNESLKDDLIKKAFNTIDSEEFWYKTLDKVNKSNLGLNGFAGLGFFLLSTEGFIGFQGINLPTAQYKK
ncbi:MAG TPA: lanthionine synthetase LanC family protein [Bacteroidales bacterium]|nr:lanthionine synthetase LanC family protein [Bacteroidales bacterium]HQJ21593.1 lanthionine synthetase LanC family protein [Bacteroidales bacterium]